MSEGLFAQLGYQICRNSLNNSVGERRFTSLFGTSPAMCSLMWGMLLEDLPEGGKPKHLLWALIFLKTYGTEHVMRACIGADEKISRKWIWQFVEAIANLDVVIH